MIGTNQSKFKQRGMAIFGFRIYWNMAKLKERWREKEMNEIQLERSADRKKKNRKGQITSNKDKQKK